MWESQYSNTAEGKMCFAVSTPVKKTPNNLNRAEIRIFVTFRPKENVANEISITNGYNFKPGSEVFVNIGNASFRFTPKDNFAWLTSFDQELNMIKTMKKGNKVEVIGISTKGTKTTDIYSLQGFTEAYQAARNNCNKK